MRPHKVESLNREGDIPFYARWSDGSEYWALPAYERDSVLPAAPDVGCPGQAVRAFHGPLFGRGLGDLHVELI